MARTQACELELIQAVKIQYRGQDIGIKFIIYNLIFNNMNSRWVKKGSDVHYTINKVKTEGH